MKNWDYTINKPLTTVRTKLWQTVRQIDWGDIGEVDLMFLREHFEEIKTRIDPAKKALLEQYLTNAHA